MENLTPRHVENAVDQCLLASSQDHPKTQYEPKEKQQVGIARQQQCHALPPNNVSISSRPIWSKSSGTAISPAGKPIRGVGPASAASTGATLTNGSPSATCSIRRDTTARSVLQPLRHLRKRLEAVGAGRLEEAEAAGHSDLGIQRHDAEMRAAFHPGRHGVGFHVGVIFIAAGKEATHSRRKTEILQGGVGPRLGHELADLDRRL